MYCQMVNSRNLEYLFGILNYESKMKYNMCFLNKMQGLDFEIYSSTSHLMTFIIVPSTLKNT